MAVLRVGHVGICVSDLPRALEFYCDLLGFRPLSEATVADSLSAKLLRLPAVDQTTVFVERDGVRLALFAFREPRALGSGRVRAMNETGMAALMLRVESLDALVEKIRAAGFRILDDTRIEHPDYGSKLLFVCDPDGMLVELIEIPGDPYAPFGKPIAR
ncbi:MAG TPA: VOC family protein [Myxococcota bacterium]|nr:VOC family protein [Myxococcota bacterium]